MKESIIKSMLFDFFDGKTTAMQRKLIEEWLAEGRNQELFYHWLDEWEAAHPQFAANQQRALVHFEKILRHHPQTPSQPAAGRGSIFRTGLRKWQIAAATVLLCSLSTFFFRKEIQYKTLESAAGQTVSYKLSEGTQVLLNANSRLTVPRFGFGKNGREVFLEGEAEFKVTHTANHDRFLVTMANNYQIEVLGTEFTAFSRARGHRVFLKNGKVKLKLPKGQQLYMKPGNLFVADKAGTFNITERADPRPIEAWKMQTFYFDNTTLSDVALQMQEHFNVKIRIADPSLGSRRIAGIYKADEVDDLLQILAELMQIEIIQKEDYIELSTPKLP